LAERSSGRNSGAKGLLEKVRLILAVVGDLKPNVASGIENRVERGRLGFAVIEPGSDNVHVLAERQPSRLSFDTNDEWGSSAISRAPYCAL
jgi:hypothetical protein